MSCLLLLLSLISPLASSFKIAVLIFGDSQFLDAAHSVKNAYIEVFGSLSYSVGNYTIEPEFIDGGTLGTKRPTNRLHLTREVVCDKVLNGSLATVIYATSVHRETRQQYLSLVSSAVYALSFYQLPAIGVMVRDAEFSKKRVYPSFVRPTPAYSDEAYVFMKLLDRLNYRQVVVLSVKGDPNGDEFVTMFEEKRRRHKIHVQRYIELEMLNTMNYTLMEEFEEVTSNIIVLFAKKMDAEKIFLAATDCELTGKGKVWIVSEDASKASNVPDGAIAPRLSQSPLSALRDAFTVVKTGLKFLDTLGKPPSPPMNCTRAGVDGNWTELQAPQFLNAICSVTTAKIEFNPRCERISVDYEIINVHEGPREVGILHGSLLRLNEASMRWAGGGNKPLEISLPKHLRAVTTHDPPFVYVTPIMRLSECVTLGAVDVDLGGKTKERVIGPWYPCPRYTVNSTESFCCAGFAIDLLSNLSMPEASSNIDTSFTFSLHLNDSYGSVLLSDDPTGYYLTGAIGELDSDMADLAVGGMSINPEREKYIDFSEPWLYHGIRILEKSIPRDSPMQSFLQPLKSSLWTALLISVVAVGLVIYCLDKKSPFDRFYEIDKDRLAADDPFLEQYEDDRVTFGEAMWFVWGVLLNSGVSEKTPRSFSARVLGIVWCGFTMIMVASYTANLAAFLVLDQPEKGLTGVTDPRLRNPSANFSFATVLNSNVYQYFKRHVELSTMFRKMEAHNVKKVDDAISALKNGSLDAFIFDSTRLDFEAARHCELRTRGALFGRSAYGIGLQKNSPWTPHITSAILRMSESGVMEALDQKWIASASPCAVEVHKAPARLGLWNMKDVFILVTCGVAFGAFFSLIEVTYGRRKASEGRKRALAIRYTDKWRRLCGLPDRPRYSYNLSRPIVRRGYAGLESCTLRDWRLKQKIRREGEHCARVTLNEPFRPEINFGRNPVPLFCSRCRNLVETDVHRQSGVFAYTWCAVFALLFLWPCSPLPFFLESFADFIHICPVCSHKIGKFRRCRGSRFYV